MRGTLRENVPEVRPARPSHRRRSGATPAIGEGQARAGEAEHAQGGHQDGYQYDLQGRLTEVRQDGDLTESYAYDDNGNRLSLETLEGSIDATYDDQDRLLTYGDFVYSYTDNGELLTKTDTSNGDVTAYEYDVFGNLVRVDLPNGDVIEYLVDGRNRRVGKRVNGTMVKQWLWASQLRIAAELDGAGTLVSRFVYGDKPTTPELVIRGSAVYRVVSDHLGSVRALVNINDPSDVPVRLDYEAFGSVSGTGVGVIPHGFAGGLYDVETGLVRFGARDYEPVLGRWVSKDPIRFDGGLNLFVYANGDPINLVDKGGMFPSQQCLEKIDDGCRQGCRSTCGGFLDAACESLCRNFASYTEFLVPGSVCDDVPPARSDRHRRCFRDSEQVFRRCYDAGGLWGDCESAQETYFAACMASASGYAQ